MLPDIIYTIETNSPNPAAPHTIGYYLSIGDANNDLAAAREMYPNAMIGEYPIGIMLDNG
jgi:hypothetical protein